MKPPFKAVFLKKKRFSNVFKYISDIEAFIQVISKIRFVTEGLVLGNFSPKQVHFINFAALV